MEWTGKEISPDGVSTFLAAVAFTLLERTIEDRQEFLNRLAHYVKRATREQQRMGNVSEADSETILRLHQSLLEFFHAAQQDGLP